MKSSLKVLLFASSFLLLLHRAQAQINATWTGTANPSDNAFSNGHNWTGGLVPTGTATIATTATVNLPGVSTTLSGDLAVTGTLVIVNAGTAGFSAQTLQVNSGGVLTLNIPTGGTVTFVDAVLSNVNNSSFIGTSAGSGVLTINGGGTLDFPSTTNGAGVGFGGTGTINQLAGNVVVTGLFGIGADGNVTTPALGSAGGTGVYNISSGTFSAAQLEIGIGSQDGGTTPTSGLLNITGGEVDSPALVLGVANGASSISNTTGAITQSAGLLNTIGGTFEIGEATGGVGSYGLGGTGTFTAGIVNVGDNAGSSGTFTQSGGTATVSSLIVGESGSGTANVSGGHLTINTAGLITLGDGPNGSGAFSQSGGTITLNGTASLNVGAAGNGTYSQSGGLITDINTGDIEVGSGTGNGTYTMSGGTLTSHGTFNVGGGTGTATFNYNGGTLTFTQSMNINANGTFNQGANFNVSAIAGTPLALNAGAVYNLDSGTLTIAGTMTTPGSSGISAASTATFNFAGGTVLSSNVSTGWQDGLNGTVTNNSTLDTAQNNIDLTGTLTGNGTLTIEGGNTVTINTLGGNSSVGAWGIDVVSGTASIDASTFPSSGALVTEASGTIELADTGSHTLSGSVSGPGNFNVNFGSSTSTLELSGPIALTGVTTLTGGGTLQALNGSFEDIGSAGKLLIGNGTSVGTVNINGTAVYNGTTTVTPGSTLLAHNITSAAALTNNGALGSNGTITSTLGATTFNIGGSYAASSGTLLIRMATVGNVVNTDVFAIAGTANVGGTTFAVVNPIATTGTFTILTSSGLIGANAIVQPASNLFVHDTFVPDSVNTNDLDLVSNTNTSATIPGQTLTPNQSAVAVTIDSLITNSSSLSPSQLTSFSALLNSIGASGTSAAQLAKNYEQLTPESLQYAQDIAFEHSAFLVSKVDGFDNALHHEFSGFDTSGVTIVLPGFNSAMGRQMQSMLAYDPSAFHPVAPNGVNYYPEGGETPTTATIDESSSPVSSQRMSDSQTTAPMPVRATHAMTIRKPYSNFSAFIGGDGTIADLNQDQGASYAPSTKASYSSVDVIGGISYRMTSNLAAGILFDYSHTDADTDSYGSKTKVDSYSPGVFATYGNKGFYLNGLFSYGRNNYSNTRAIPVVGANANSNPDGNQYTAALDAGQDLHLGDAWTLTPQGGLTYTHLDVDGFTETGAAPADLSVQAQHDDSLRSRLGASLSYATYAGHLTLLPTFTALWQHEFMDENAPITSSFNDFSSSSFTIHSVSQGRDSALISVGLTAQLDNSMAIFIQANADLNGNYNAENFVGGFKGSF
jgi:outer membrane autotransporter protein